MFEADELARILVSGSELPSVRAPSGRMLPPRDYVQDNFERAFAKSSPDLKNFGLEKLIDDARKAIIHVYNDSSPRVDSDQFVIESIIVPDGSRPVFFIENGKVVDGFGSGPFVDRLKNKKALVESVSKSVGRIESDLRIADPWMNGVFYLGTAFVVGDHVAMTNRHVVQEMVRGSSAGSGPFKLNGPWWLNFDGEVKGLAKRRFAITEVLWADPAVVKPTSGLAPFDAALLRIGEPEQQGDVLPPALPITASVPAKAQTVGIVGYPGKPRVIVEDETAALRCEEESDRALMRLLDGRFGFKRCGSGEIDEQPGFDEDTSQWTIKHDVSTLGGNSGSPIFDLSVADRPVVLAAHFGGCSRKENYGAVFEKLGRALHNAGANFV
jgi:Trypsin-like peptidase domain